MHFNTSYYIIFECGPASPGYSLNNLPVNVKCYYGS